MKKRSKVSMLVIVLVIIAIFYLTFKNLTDSVALTRKFIRFLNRFGIRVGVRQMRHYVHYFEYGVLGLALAAFSWHGIWIGAIIGLLDETVKIWLPGREFDGSDLLRDIVAVTVVICVVNLVRYVVSLLQLRRSAGPE